QVIATTDPIDALAAIPPEKRRPEQAQKLRAYYLQERAAAPIRRAWQELVTLRQERERLLESVPTTMVMEERATPRATYVLIRGAYDKPGEPVTPNIPASLSLQSRDRKGADPPH